MSPFSSDERPDELPTPPALDHSASPTARWWATRLTRRTAVRAGAVLGTAAWLGGVLPSTASANRSGGRSVTVRRSDLAPGRIVGPIAAPTRFDLVGATIAGLEQAGVRIRARTRGGRWSAWQSLDAHDGHAPDGRRATMGDPLWFGDADELQLRASRRPTRDVRLDLIRVAPATKRAVARAGSRAIATARATPQSGATAPGAATTRSGVPTIIPRSAWASGLKVKGSPATGQVQVAFVHHTVNGNDYAASDSGAMVRAIAEYHMRSNGWNDIGYNFLVDRYGQIFEGREGGIDQAIIGAQAVGWNSISTGIAIIGTFMGTAAPEPAINAVAALIGWKLPLHGAPTAGSVSLVSSGGAGNRWAKGARVDMPRISGHQDGCSTDCPGTVLYGQLATIRNRVGDVGPAAVSTETSLSISTTGGTPTYGKALAIKGRYLRDGLPTAATSVVIQKKGPSGSWVPLTTATTGDNGDWSTTLTWRAASPIRAVIGELESKELNPGLNPGLSVDQPTRRVRRRTNLLVTGRARGVSEVDLVLERQVGKSYERVSRKTVKVRGGKFSGRLPVRVSAKHRVVAQATSAGRSYNSPRRYLRSTG